MARQTLASRSHSTKPASVPPKLGPRLCDAMVLRGIKRKELAARLGYSEPVIASWRTGRGKPSLLMLIELAEILDVTTDWLLGRD